MSDSEESTKSSNSNDNEIFIATPLRSNGIEALSLVAEFDDLVRMLKQKRSNDVEDKFIDYVEQTLSISNLWDRSVKECRRLQGLLELKTQELTDMENKLLIARRLLDKEKKEKKRIEDERDRMVVFVNVCMISILICVSNVGRKFNQSTRASLKT